jgi:Na+-translocating ferredoxin:NAD+ oxidoreductase RnfG subunit
MSDAIVVALIGTIGALLTAVIVEFVRRERAQKANDRKMNTMLGQMTPNSGSSMHDAVTSIRATVEDVRKTQGQHGERLAAVEAHVEHLRS